MTGIGIRFQQYALAVLAPLMAITFWSRVGDPVNVPKSTLAAVVAVLLLTISAIRIAATRRVYVPRAPAAWAAIAFGAALVLATVTSDVPGASVAGTLGRSDGLILYGACVALFVVGLRVLESSSIRWLVRGLLVGGLFAASYGLLQWRHIDAINWADVGISPIIGTFGNPDFEAGYVGIVVPAAAWGALTRTWSRPWRAAASLIFLLCTLVAVVSSSVQGLLAGGGGLVVLGFAVLLNHGGTLGRRGLWALTAAATAVGLIAVTGIFAGVGPGQRLVSEGSLTARKWYWHSAIEMWQHSPFTGVGLDRYGAHYRSVRPPEAAAANNYSDAAHSVPLHLLATGGVLLAISYVALVVLVAWALVRGLQVVAGEDRLLLGAVGGAWVAYQVQSLVSIDQPALAVTHWLLAAAVVATAGRAQFHERLLPGAVQPRGRKGRRISIEAPPPPVWSGATLTVVVVVCTVGLAACWLVLKPLRASYDIRGAALSLSRGEGNPALDQYDAATRLAPYEASYWLQRGKFLEQVKQPDLAATSYARAIEYDARAWDVLVAGAVLAKAQNDTAAYEDYTSRLAHVDPGGTWRSRVSS